MVSLEVVVVCVELDQDSVWQDYNAVDDSEKHFADRVIDGREVCYIGCAGEVQFEHWWVDESDLSSSNLQWIRKGKPIGIYDVTYQGNDVCERA